jgi:hypothetical protein
MCSTERLQRKPPVVGRTIIVPTTPIVTGLDRMLRIYDTSTKRKQVSCLYLKQRVNYCVLVG